MRDPDEQYLSEERVTNFHPFRDLTLKEEVAEALTFLDEVDTTRVDVEAKEGVVTLSGEVYTERDKELVLECASDVDGVLMVLPDLSVQIPS